MYTFDNRQIFPNSSLMGLMCAKALEDNHLKDFVQNIADDYKNKLIEEDKKYNFSKDSTKLYYVEKENRNLKNLFMGHCYYGLSKQNIEYLKEKTLAEILPIWLNNITPENWKQTIYYFYRPTDYHTSCPSTALWLLGEDTPTDFILQVLTFPNSIQTLKNSECDAFDLIWLNFLNKDERLVDLLIEHQVWPDYFYEGVLNPCVKNQSLFDKVIQYVPLSSEMGEKEWRQAKYIAADLYETIIHDGDINKWNALYQKCGLGYEIFEVLIEHCWRGHNTCKMVNFTEFSPHNTPLSNLMHVLIKNFSLDQIDYLLLGHSDRDTKGQEDLKKFLTYYFELLNPEQMEQWGRRILNSYNGQFRLDILQIYLDSGGYISPHLFLEDVKYLKSYSTQDHSLTQALKWVIDNHYKVIFNDLEEKDQYNILNCLLHFSMVKLSKNFNTTYKDLTHHMKEELESVRNEFFEGSFLRQYVNFVEFFDDVINQEKVPSKYFSVLQMHLMKKEAKHKVTKRVVLL